MKETTIYLIRHAEAEGNLYRRIHGNYDSDVTENGRLQMAALAERFREIPLDAVYSSDLTRTCRTACAVAEPKGLPLRKDSRFREIGLGLWEDVPFGELELTDPEQLRNFNENPKAWRVEGAETLEDCTGRFLAGLQDAVSAEEGGSIAIFTHGGILARTLSALFPDSPTGHSDNTAVTMLRFDGSFHLVYRDDNFHLTEEISTLARQNWWRGDPKHVDHNLWFRPYEGEIDWYLELMDEEIPVSPMASLQFAMLGKKPVGLLQLDPEQGQAEGVGTVDYLALSAPYRGKRLGDQLVGCAVSFFRNLGRDAIRVTVGERFRDGIPFLLHAGFRDCGGGSYEKKIRVQTV